MSVLNIKAALETAIATISPSIPTVWENTTYIPIVDIPYQQVWFLDFLVNGYEINISSYQVNSFFQIDLMYPLLTGTGAVLLRAEQIKTLFKQGSSFVNNGQTVNIIQTPVIGGGKVENDRWKVIVKVYYSSWIIVN